MAANTWRVLLVQEGGTIRSVLADDLETLGYQVVCASDEVEALHRHVSVDPSVILVDLDGETGAGLAICRRMIEQSGAPLVVMASPSAQLQIVAAFDIGVADFVIRPFDISDLVFRITTALLRKQKWQSLLTMGPVDSGHLTIHPARRVIEVRGVEVIFPRREYDILTRLALQPRKIVTRNELVNDVWKHGPVHPNTLDLHIRRIRQKIEADPREPTHLITVRNLGFYFDPEGVVG